MLPENYQLPKPEQKPVLEDDTYQVVIKDISEAEGKNFQTGEPETTLEFTFEVVEGDSKGHEIKKWVTPKYAPAKNGRSESNLYAIVTKAMKKVVASDELHIHELIGKQLKIIVSKYTNEDGYDRNKIVSYLQAKSDVKSEDVKTASSDEVDIEEIPF
jgi:hypothetical protein